MKFNLDVKRSMAKAYLDGYTISGVCDIFGCSNGVVRSAMSIFGVRAREQGSKYILQEDFFANIDTEDKAYWLGMLITDGTVRSNKNRNEIVLSLKESDNKHIDKFLLSIRSNAPKRFITRGKSMQAYASITSRTMKNDLSKWNVVPKKTFIVVPPKLHPDMQRHFWRGCVDGDGSIYPNIKGNYHCSFNGTKPMVQGFVEFLYKHGIDKRKVYSRGKIFSVSYACAESVREITDLLYGCSNIYLDRKYKLYRNIVQRSA